MVMGVLTAPADGQMHPHDMQSVNGGDAGSVIRPKSESTHYSPTPSPPHHRSSPDAGELGAMLFSVAAQVQSSSSSSTGYSDSDASMSSDRKPAKKRKREDAQV